MRPPSPRVRRVLTVVAAALVGLAGAWLGMRLAGAMTVEMGPFRVDVAATFGKGETQVGVPPFGSLTADTHLAPLHLAATLRDIGVERLTDVVNRVGIDGLVSQVEDDARAAIPWVALRAELVAAFGALALGALVFRRRWRLVVVATLTGLLAVTACEGLAAATFDTRAFAEPRYSGSLALAPKLIGPVQEASGKIDDLRAGLEQIVDGTVRAYGSLQAQPVSDDVIRVLHISDIHASPLGMDFAEDVARGFDVDMVIDTGDLTSFATPVENLIVSRIPEFGVPYVFTRGSHDSLTLQNEVAHTSNGVVLDGRAVTIDGLTIYGLGHPAFTPARGAAIDDAAFAALARSVGPQITADVERLGDVDVVAVHDDRMAEDVAGHVPLVISGHFHETRARVVDGTLYLRIGTTGGSGAGVFRGLDVPFSAEVLYFSRGPSPKLLAYDVVTQQADSASLSVQRVTVSQEFGDLVPSPPPTPSASPSVSPTPSGSGASGSGASEPSSP